MSLVPGLGIVKGMALTLRRFFEPKATIKYPEQHADVAPKFRGRLQLLYDEWGTLKCETCFQCAQACPIECIDMGGIDTKGRFHVHWGAARDVRRAPRGVRAAAVRPAGRRTRPTSTSSRIDLAPLDAILERVRLRPEARCWRSSRRPRPSTATCRSPRSSTSRADRRLVRDALRHGDLLPPPPVRAAGGDGVAPRRRGATAPEEAGLPVRARTRRSAARGARPMTTVPRDPPGLAAAS